jgi:hypothetical protein
VNVKDGLSVTNDTNPFKGRRPRASPPMRVLYRFRKPDGRLAEIRERTVTQLRAIEFFVFINGELVESQMFHGERNAEYPAALQTRIRQFAEGGWVVQPDENGSAIPS